MIQRKGDLEVGGKASSPTGQPRTIRNPALVHDWLTGMRGGERCLEVFADLLPGAPILTLIHEPGTVSDAIEEHPIVASPLSRWGFMRRRYRRLLPLFPWAVKKLPGRDHDLLVSLSHCAAKAIPRREGTRHVCYCFTPARYLWDHADTYLAPERSSASVRLAARTLLPNLRNWDQRTASSVDRFIAISDYVAERIKRIYGRDSEVIYPPVETARFRAAPTGEIEDHYLMVTALAPYKGVDLAIKAFTGTDRRLVIVGTGDDEARLRELAPPNVEFRGWLSDEEVAHALARCRGFILPCEEDFGIAPLEAMAAGRPVIALGRGGARETVVDSSVSAASPTGVFFDHPEPDSLSESIERFERELPHFDTQAIRRHAETFDLTIFRERIRQVLRSEGAEV